MSWRGRSRRALPYLIAATTGFLIAYLIVAFVIFPADIIPDDAIVPGVVGVSYSEAVRTLSQAGFKAERGETRFHASAPTQQVLQQEPTAGSRERTGTSIKLHISSGQRTSTVPRVLGMTRQAAQIGIENAGLDVGRIDLQHSDLPAGQVIGARPAAGERLNLPAKVDLVVSRGPATSQVPNLVGEPLPVARSRLQVLGLLVGRVDIDSLSFEPPNTIISHDPPAGATVPAGGMINFQISGRRR